MFPSVVIPTYNPDPERLKRTFEGLCAQTLPVGQWETILIDNASTRFPNTDFFLEHAPVGFRMIHEPRQGLTQARMRGIRESRGDLIIFVDDDNVPAPDYLSCAIAIFLRSPQLGAAGGKVLPEFESPPEPWIGEFLSLLALRDLGDKEQVAGRLKPTEEAILTWPDAAPIGAGMVLRREAAEAWLQSCEAGLPPEDRTGGTLSSGGDNDIVLSIMKPGWTVGYFPHLYLTHIVPSGRTAPAYLSRLNRGIQRSWVNVLARHSICPWKPIRRWTVPLRAARAWFRTKAWTSPQARIRWHGLLGRFQGQADISVQKGICCAAHADQSSN